MIILALFAGAMQNDFNYGTNSEHLQTHGKICILTNPTWKMDPKPNFTISYEGYIGLLHINSSIYVIDLVRVFYFLLMTLPETRSDSELI